MEQNIKIGRKKISLFGIIQKDLIVAIKKFFFRKKYPVLGIFIFFLIF
jgi:hypothetical protein